MTGSGRNEHFLRRIREQRARRRRRRWVGLGLVIAGLAYVVVFGDAGLLAVGDAERLVEERRASVESTRERAEAAEAALAELLVPSGEALERTARELYRMQRPGEEVYHLIGGEIEEGADPAP